MTRTMYDAAKASNIPTTAEAVAGYIAGTSYIWSAADWARFPDAVKVHIVVYRPGHEPPDDGDVLDVEAKDAPRAQQDGVVDRWVTRRRNAGVVTPCVYTSHSTWDHVRGPNRVYWIAQYTGTPHLIAGTVATQYDHPPHSGGGFDLSVVDLEWIDSFRPPAPVPTPAPAPSPIPPEEPELFTVLFPGFDAAGRKPFVKVDRTGATYAYNGAPEYRALSTYGESRTDIIGAELAEDGRIILTTNQQDKELNPDGTVARYVSPTFGLERY